jgi:hypothetical protein
LEVRKLSATAEIAPAYAITTKIIVLSKSQIYQRTEPLVKKYKMKLLLDLHDARLAPTKPGYGPA